MRVYGVSCEIGQGTLSPKKRDTKRETNGMSVDNLSTTILRLILKVHLKVRKHDFVRRKYNREFHIDCVFFSEADRRVTIGEAFCYSFHGIFLLNQGSVKISIDHSTYELDGGSFIFLRANEVRKYLAVTPDFSGYLLIFENEFIETFFQDSLFIYRFQYFQTNLPPVLGCDRKPLLEYTKLCEQIRSELTALEDDSHHYIRSLLYNILIQINRAYILEYGLTNNLFHDDITLRFRRALEENLRNNLNVGEYADLLKLSRSQLNKALTKTSGRSASTIIRDRLLTEIKRDLLYSNDNVSQIAHKLGFSDLSNFVRFYKKQTGHTPGEFRSGQAK